MSRKRSHPQYASLRRMGFDSYAEYLRSRHWRDTKRRYRAAALPQTCYCCGEPEVHLHHKTYERLGCERLDDLVPLCPRCHSLVHELERRGDIALDLHGLLDATRASLYRKAKQVNADRARHEWDLTHRSPQSVDARSLAAITREVLSRARLRGLDVSREVSEIRAQIAAMHARIALAEAQQ